VHAHWKAFSVNDFKALTTHVTGLHQSCSLVKHDAPSDFQALSTDLSELVVVMARIIADLETPDSTLLAHGERRWLTLGTISKKLEETLTELGKIVDQYKPLAAGNGMRNLWGKVQWMMELPRIQQIRLDLGFNMNSLQLILASIGK
jgi:hypothetical protein